MLRDGLLRTIVVLVDCRVLVEFREGLDVRGREIVVRLGVLILGRELMDERLLELRLDILGLELRLDVIVLERLGVELRVETLGALLRVGDLDILGRLTLLVVDLRDCELEAAALRLLLELLLFRELRDAKTGSTVKVKIKR